MTPTEAEVLVVHEALSVARMETFKNAVGNSPRRDAAALDLYAWNAQVSSALLMPLHVCEVVIRNAVSEALLRRFMVSAGLGLQVLREVCRAHIGDTTRAGIYS